MLLNLQTETAMGLARLARSLPRVRKSPGGNTDAPTSPATIWRWITVGCRTVDGQVVKLEAAKLGGHWVSSAEALDRFIRALTNGVIADVPAPTAAKTVGAGKSKGKLAAAGI